MKVWTVSEREVRPREPIFEHESKMIHSLNALGLVCCTYNQRTVLMVSQEDWQVRSIASCLVGWYRRYMFIKLTGVV